MLRALPWFGARATWSCGMTLQERRRKKAWDGARDNPRRAAAISCQKMAPAPGPAPRSFVCLSRTSGRAAGNCVIDHEQHRGSHDRDEHAVKIEAGDAGCAERGEEIAAHHGADDAEHNIHQHSLTCSADKLARDEACDQSQYNPGDNRHLKSPRSCVGNADAYRTSLEAAPSRPVVTTAPPACADRPCAEACASSSTT